MGARLLWHFISSSRYLPKKYRDTIESVVSSNASFAAPENMSMLTDERCHIRTLAARRSFKAREIGPDGNCVHRFVIPAVKGTLELQTTSISLIGKLVMSHRLQFSDRSVDMNL
ncbi:hypothetical protein AVEN_112194-1 [Araneus ventricosus]|uniref:Uncharacterized protein n=1 Tax=Araneus ventricosus TaxID=182803 RepID=A0A4Y2G2I2_ARAVE|nr:hypothetical protein AVEN_112194-1 [Araneus ventricosus]